MEQQAPPMLQQDTSPMSMKDWFITLLISYIPLVGLIMLLIWAFIVTEAPWPTADTVITAAIPMMIPRAVSRERPLLRSRARRAIRRMTSHFIRSSRPACG